MNKKNNDPIVSVVMSVFNEDDGYLRESVESILNQSFYNLELVIVIDGSSNKNNSDYIKSLNDHRVKCLFNIVNMGLSYSINKAISFSKGQYVFRMDSDDISMQNRIRLQLNELIKGSDVVSSRGILIDSNNLVRGLSGPFFYSNYIYRFLLYRTNRFNPAIHPSVAGKREIFINNPYNIDIKYGQDYELWKRLYSKGIKIDFMKERLIFYRIKSINRDKDLYQQKIMKISNS